MLAATASDTHSLALRLPVRLAAPGWESQAGGGVHGDRRDPGARGGPGPPGRGGGCQCECQWPATHTTVAASHGASACSAGGPGPPGPAIGGLVLAPTSSDSKFKLPTLCGHGHCTQWQMPRRAATSTSTVVSQSDAQATSTGSRLRTNGSRAEPDSEDSGPIFLRVELGTQLELPGRVEAESKYLNRDAAAGRPGPAAAMRLGGSLAGTGLGVAGSCAAEEPDSEAAASC